LLSLIGVLPCFGQEAPEPKFDIPSTIAKRPERSDFAGDWLRADGTYRLQVSDADGTVAVHYFNPI
jgi:hypothetical protein